MTKIDSELVEKLVGILGPTLVFIAASAKYRSDVKHWQAGDPMANGQHERLQVADECLQEIIDRDGAGIARAWFIGRNTGQFEISPAEALGEGSFDLVRQSAKQLVNDEWL